jgi:hypothetical protein
MRTDPSGIIRGQPTVTGFETKQVATGRIQANSPLNLSLSVVRGLLIGVKLWIYNSLRR